MKYCEECKVKVATKTETCPLCKTPFVKLDGEEYKTYPDFKLPPKKLYIRTRIFFFIVLTTVTICVLANLLTQPRPLWCIIVTACMLYAWLLVDFTIISKVNLGLKLLVQSVALPILLYIINAVSENRMRANFLWSLSYALPFILMAFTLTMTVTIAITTMRWRDYTLYQLSITVLGFIPIVIVLLLGQEIIWPSIVSCVYSFLTLILTFLFMDKRTKNELRKRFHL